MGSELLTNEEIFYSGKENIAGFTTLVHFFLPTMRVIESAAIINIDNDPETKLADRIHNVYFTCAVAFVDEFTKLVAEGENIKGITVHTDFKKLEDQETQARFCKKVFSFVGIKKEIYFL